jgi:hypothetical protein
MAVVSNTDTGNFAVSLFVMFEDVVVSGRMVIQGLDLVAIVDDDDDGGVIVAPVSSPIMRALLF